MIDNRPDLTLTDVVPNGWGWGREDYTGLLHYTT